MRWNSERNKEDKDSCIITKYSKFKDAYGLSSIMESRKNITTNAVNSKDDNATLKMNFEVSD